MGASESSNFSPDEKLLDERMVGSITVTGIGIRPFTHSILNTDFKRGNPNHPSKGISFYFFMPNVIGLLVKTYLTIEILCLEYYSSCLDLLLSGRTKNGVYKIQSNNQTAFEVQYVDLTCSLYLVLSYACVH